jgi:hypothetical protein
LSDRPRSPSRRALLRALSAAPLLLAAGAPRSAEAQTEIDDLLKTTKLLGEEAARFRRVVDRLWDVFRAAVGDDSRIAAGVFRKGWDLSSGHVEGNIAQFPASGRHPATDQCAFACGQLALQYAGNDPITPAIFERAWRQISDDMHSKLARVQRVSDDKPKISALAC